MQGLTIRLTIVCVLNMWNIMSSIIASKELTKAINAKIAEYRQSMTYTNSTDKLFKITKTCSKLRRARANQRELSLLSLNISVFSILVNLASLHIDKIDALKNIIKLPDIQLILFLVSILSAIVALILNILLLSLAREFRASKTAKASKTVKASKTSKKRRQKVDDKSSECLCDKPKQANLDIWVPDTSENIKIQEGN